MRSHGSEHPPRTRLAALRLASGLSQDELSDAAGLPRATYWRLEAGRIDNPAIRDLAACAAVLGLPLEDLIEPSYREPTATRVLAARPLRKELRPYRGRPELPALDRLSALPAAEEFDSAKTIAVYSFAADAEGGIGQSRDYAFAELVDEEARDGEWNGERAAEIWQRGLILLARGYLTELFFAEEETRGDLFVCLDRARLRQQMATWSESTRSSP